MCMYIKEKLDLVKWILCFTVEKFLGTPEVWRNCALSSHIRDGLYYEFNEWTLV